MTDAQRVRAENKLRLEGDVARERAGVVDAYAFTRAERPSEIVGLLREAEATGTLAEAWRHAEPKLREMAKGERARYRLPDSNSAQGVWAMWVQKVTRPSAHAQDGAIARARRDIRDHVLEVAEVGGLRQPVMEALTRKVGTEPADKSFTVGRFWDQHPGIADQLAKSTR